MYVLVTLAFSGCVLNEFVFIGLKFTLLNVLINLTT